MACVCLVVGLHMPLFTEGAGHCTRCGMVLTCLQGMHCLCGRYRIIAVQTSHDQAIRRLQCPRPSVSHVQGVGFKPCTMNPKP